VELVDPSCFDGLSEEEKQAQLYLAYYTWAGDDTLLDPDCFLAYPHRDEAIYAALKVQGGTVEPECIEGMAPEERYQAMYEAVYAAASDDTLTDPGCFLSLSPEVRDLAFYTALYVIADDADLVSPECFMGSSREEQREAIYAAVYQINQEPVNPIPALSPMMWLRADVLVLEDEDPVDTWPDGSGNSNDATQGTFASMPVYRASSIGGLPSVQFDGVDDWLSIPIQSGIMQYFAVFRSIAATFNAYWGLIDNGGTDNGSTRMGFFESGQTYFHSNPYPDGVRKNGVVLAAPFDCAPISTAMVIAVRPCTDGGGGTLANWTRGIGCIGNLGFGNFTLAELVAFNAVQSAENTAAIEQYLANKYGITL
jgi:hypothetical protein